MRNPLRSENEAFRFLIVVIAGAAIIAVGAAIDRWVGVGAAVLVVGGVGWWLVKAPSGEPPAPKLTSATPPGMHRILVVANETVGGRPLREELDRRAQAGRTEILVVAPALNSPVRHWVSDEDGARSAAQKRVEESVARLAETGLTVRGEVGDGEPLQAIEDALRTFGADELVVSTHPPGRSHWLEQGLIEKARERFALPLTHVVVDLEREEVR